MQIFLPYINIIEVAKCLDNRRLHKQIVECYQIMKAIKGESEAWKNHPICKMYKNNLKFLEAYTKTLELYKELSKNTTDSVLKNRMEVANKEAMSLIPSFITEEYLSTMKGRLYVKDSSHYAVFAPYEQFGDQNMYFVDDEWRIYKQKV